MYKHTLTALQSKCKNTHLLHSSLNVQTHTYCTPVSMYKHTLTALQSQCTNTHLLNSSLNVQTHLLHSSLNVHTITARQSKCTNTHLLHSSLNVQTHLLYSSLNVQTHLLLWVKQRPKAQAEWGCCGLARAGIVSSRTVFTSLPMASGTSSVADSPTAGPLTADQYDSYGLNPLLSNNDGCWMLVARTLRLTVVTNRAPGSPRVWLFVVLNLTQACLSVCCVKI